jgi:parallel beta-helix repeat protein
MTKTRDLANLGGGFIQAGGGVQRAVEERLKDVVSVKDFGAEGDGVTNDTAAIQAAFNSGASHIYYPTGVYLQQSIAIPTSVNKVYGSGTVKQYSTDTNIFTGVNLTGLSIYGLKILGNYTAPQSGYSSNNIAVLLTNCSNVHISECQFSNIQSTAVRLILCSASSVVNNSIYLCGQGVYLQACSDVSVRGNTIKNTILANSVFTIGISLESTDGHSNGINSNVVVAGNVVSGYLNAQGIMAHSGKNITFDSNVVKDALTGISINPFNLTDVLTNITISGNVLEGPSTVSGVSTGANDGIVCQGGPGTATIQALNITGNTVSGFNKVVGHAAQAGIRIGYTRNASVIGNTISDCSCNGIILTSNEDYAVVSSNNIDAIAAGSVQNGILLLQGGSGLIGENFIANVSGGSGVGIYITSVSTFRLRNNHFSNVTTYVVNGQFEQATLYKEITATGASVTVDLSGVDAVVFNQASPSTITGFTGVVPYRLYRFYFVNGNTTIDRSNAFLNGSANQSGTANDVLLMLGRTTTTLSQAAPISVNG